MRQRADQILRGADLGFGDIRLGAQAERHGMREGVVADPVPFPGDAIEQRTTRGIQ
jgi:hypothetical protein